MPYKIRDGAQPGYYRIKEQRRSIAVVAQAIDVPYLHLRNALYGVAAPSLAVRERLPKLLGLRLDEVFDAQTLAREYKTTHGRKR